VWDERGRGKRERERTRERERERENERERRGVNVRVSNGGERIGESVCVQMSERQSEKWADR